MPLIYTNRYNDGEGIFEQFPFVGEMKKAIQQIRETNDPELRQHAIDYFDEIIEAAPLVNASFALLKTGTAMQHILPEDDIDDGADSIVAFLKYFEELGYNTSTWAKK